MATIAVTGLYTLETNLHVAGFPLEYAPVHYPFHGISQGHSGVGFNVSVALSGLGNSVRFATYVGSDFLGDQIISALPDLGLTDRFSLRYCGNTSQSVILVASDGNRQIHCDLKDLQDCVYPNEQIPELLDQAQLAVVCNINFARPVLSSARDRGIPVATDVHALGDFDDSYNREFLEAATIVFLSHENLPCSPVDAVQALRSRYCPEVIVVGLGKDGALLSERDQGTLHVPSIEPRGVVNTVGAGDALFSAFLDQYLLGHSPSIALHRAALFAGWKVGESGATKGLLSADSFFDLCGVSQLQSRPCKIQK